jgi:hypothetical protein
VANGDAVTITVSYSPADTVFDYTSGGGGALPSYCATEGGQSYCFNLPTFVPSASK